MADRRPRGGTPAEPSDPPPERRRHAYAAAVRGGVSFLLGGAILLHEEFGHGSGNSVLLIGAFAMIALPFAELGDFFRRWGPPR